MKKKSDSSKCSAGSVASVLGYSRANKKNKDGKIEITHHKKEIFGTLKPATGNQRDFIVEDFYKARKPRKSKIAPALRSDRTGLKVYDIFNQRMRKDEISGTLRPNFTKGSRSGFAVSGRTTTTNTPVKSTGKDSGIKSSSREIFGTLERRTYPTMTSSQLASLVRVFPLRADVEVFKTSQGELFSSRSAESYEIKDRATYSLRMLRDYFLTTKAGLSRLYSFRWMNLGMMRNGLSQTLSITYRRTGRGSLSSVLEEKVSEKYYLSEKTLEKIMEKKDAHPDIRWKSGIKGEGRVPFPDNPDKPSRSITTAEGGASRMTHGILVDRGKIKKADISTAIDSNYFKGLDNHAQRTFLLHNIYGGFGEKKPRIFEDESPTIRTPRGGGHLPNVVEPLRWERTEKGKKARRESQKKGRDYTPFNEGHRKLVPSKKDIVGCVTNALNKDALILADRTRSYAGKGRNLESPKPITNALSGVQKDNLLLSKRIRRLTPKECERLQGFPDDWTKGVSDTQRYRQMGNAVSVPVIEAIGRKILECVG